MTKKNAYFIYTSRTPGGHLAWAVGKGVIFKQSGAKFIMRITKIIKSVRVNFFVDYIIYPRWDEVFETLPETKYALLKMLIEGKWKD